MVKKYKINSGRIKLGYTEGFAVTPTGIVTQGDGIHRLYLRALDKGRAEAGVPETPWGRLTFKAVTGDDTAYSVTVLCADEKEAAAEGGTVNTDAYLTAADSGDGMAKKRFLEELGAETFVNASDILLYGQKGRYLWICMEVRGGYSEFSDFAVYAPGDNFYRTFPEVYRQGGEFFHRYISVFSSLYNDLQEKIDKIHEIFSVDTAPPEMLVHLARWLGIELEGDFLSADQMRSLLKIAPDLIKEKGTRRAIERAVSIFVKEQFYIVEQRNSKDSFGTRTAFASVYGSDSNCFSVLINRRADEKLQAALLCLINLFKPVRTRARIVFIGDVTALDAGGFLDVGARITQTEKARLDSGASLTGKFLLD
jgi:phage tail-like protein